MITGIAGQDGRLLAEYLFKLDYQIIGVGRPGKAPEKVKQQTTVQIDTADLANPASCRKLIETWQPDVIYQLAAAHHSSQENTAGVTGSRKLAMLTTNFATTQNLALAMLATGSPAHLVFAASSQMYTANHNEHEIAEDSPRNPGTFYGHTKSWSANFLAFMRSECGLRASTAILFNHESALRSEQFVTRKISRAAAAAKKGSSVKLGLQNIGARVDWSNARDVVHALHLLTADTTGHDCVVASGTLHSVRDLLYASFACVNLDWHDYVEFQTDQVTPALSGQARKIRQMFGWRPEHSFLDTVAEMVEHDLAQLESGHSSATA